MQPSGSWYDSPVDACLDIAQTLAWDKDAPGWKSADLLRDWGCPIGGISDPGAMEVALPLAWICLHRPMLYAFAWSFD